MGISRSPDEWSVSADVYSGRPNPAWAIPASTAERLAARWERLPAGTGQTEAAPSLGYRGVTLTAPDGRKWVAHGGVVTIVAADRQESHADTGREWERALLLTAPPDVLPPGL